MRASIRTNSFHRRAILFLSLLLLLLPLVAKAELKLISAVPAAESQFTFVPQNLAMLFSEAVSKAGFELRDEKGESLALGKPYSVGNTIIAPINEHKGYGVYTVKWSVETSDGKAAEGRYKFTVTK